MKSALQVLHTSHADLPKIYEFFDASIRYQEAKGYPVWRNYDKGAITRDIDDRNQYKILHGNNNIAIVFSVCYTDKSSGAN